MGSDQRVAASFDPTRAPRIDAEGARLSAVTPERLQPDAIRRRLTNPPAWTPESRGDPVRPDELGDTDAPRLAAMSPAAASLASLASPASSAASPASSAPLLAPLGATAGTPAARRSPTPAAVLIPIVLRDPAPTVLLTRRTAHLNDHAGQIAFPGGRHDEGDRSPEHTALREAHEEVGLVAEHVEILGRLPEYRTITRYVVTPVVALVRPGFTLALDPFEVDEAFEVPLAFLMDPANHERRMIPSERGEPTGRMFWAMPWRPHAVEGPEYFIWGATAAMLRNLYRLLST